MELNKDFIELDPINSMGCQNNSNFHWIPASKSDDESYTIKTYISYTKKLTILLTQYLYNVNYTEYQQHRFQFRLTHTTTTLWYQTLINTV
jgi:hypothetical protein